MKIKKRLLLLLLITFAGAILFLPFVFANDSSVKGDLVYQTALIFTFASVAAVALTAWGGLVFSDRLNIPMPLLRNWEYKQPIDAPRVKSLVLYSVVAGGLLAVCLLTANYFIHPPVNKGSFWVRIVTAIWAPVVTETVSHLFVLSGLILLIKNTWISIIISAMLFVVLFHLNASFGTGMMVYLSIANFAGAALTGYLFVKKGFEAAILTHMVMHLIMLGVNI